MKLTLVVTTILASLSMMPHVQASCLINFFQLWVVPKDGSLAWKNKIPGGDDPWIMTDGDVLCIDTYYDFNIEADVDCVPGATATFDLSGPFNHYRKESLPPYFAFGNGGDDYSNVFGKDATIVGDYSLTTTLDFSQGPETITFSIIDCDVCDKCQAREELYFSG